MFDNIAIQTKFLKDMVNDSKKNQLACYTDDKHTYIAYPAIAYKILNADFYLKCDTVKQSSNLQRLFMWDVSHEWSITDTCIRYSDIGNKYAYEFKDESSKSMYIDKKLLDTLKIKPGDNVRFYAESNLSVMKIVQDYEVKAVVMPVKIKGQYYD